MKVSIGILAHNEEKSIASVLDSLWKQSLICHPEPLRKIEVIIVCNGCSDRTAEVAQNTLQKLEVNTDSNLLYWKIEEVKEPGKSNAWNLLVHQFSAIDADFFCLMDADIVLYAKDTLAKMLNVLHDNPEYWIALDRPIKDVELKKNKNILEKLSVAVSKASNEGQLYICGQLYCGRSSALRDFWMPVGLPVEDGFLTQMIISENFTVENPTFTKRIVRVSEASHIFEAYTNPLELIDHEVRVVVGIVVNSFLTRYFREICNEELTAGTLIAKMNQENHLWLNDFVRDVTAQNSWWLIPIPLVFRRYRSLKSYFWLLALIRLPIATLAFIVDLSVFIRANNKLRSKAIANYW